MAQSFGPKLSANSGNIFFALFGAIALIGILGAGVMTFMKGPLATSVKLTRQNTAENQMNIAGQVAVMASAANGDCETVADGFVEPVEWRDAGALGHPANGGLIPLTIGVSKKDPWGTEYGYCGWDHGASNSATDAGCGGAGQKRLSGTNSTAFPVVAMVSAGPDKVFTTTCRTFTTADVNADGDLDDTGVDLPLVSKASETDDDLIFTYTYEEATGASGGLWSLKSGDASTATINKDIEVSGTGTFDRIGATGSDYLEMLSGLKLPNPSVMSVCNATNAGVMRLNASATGIEICDGVSAWNEVTGSGGGGGGGGGGSGLYLSPNISSGMNVANGNPTCVAGTCYGSNVTFTLTNNLDPAAASAVLSVSLSNTTDFEKVSDNCHGNSIAAGAACQIVVRAKANGNRSYSAVLSITGNNSPLATLDGTASGFGCTIGGNGPGGKYAGCAMGGYDLIVTPSGCTAGTSNPTCAGGADTVAMASCTTSSITFSTNSASGLQNTVNQVAYTGGAYSFPAVAHCSALSYGGYDDWYLPSLTEMMTLYANRALIGGSLGTSTYVTSNLSTPILTPHYWFLTAAGTGGSTTCGGTNLIRCVRRDPSVTFPSATTDITPLAVTFTPSSSTAAGETRVSNTVMVQEITQPVTLSVSGGSGAQFSKNGGAYTSTSTTVTNGDTVTLRATSPVAGQEDNVAVTIGASGFTWKVRTVGNNTIYAFVTATTTTGAIGIPGADALCNSQAAAAGLGGSWIAALATGTGVGEGPASRVPWNWTTLKNMNNATVATSWNDLTDGTISAPINRTAANAASGASFVWTGAPETSGKDGRCEGSEIHNCATWSSLTGAYGGYYGVVNSTTQHWVLSSYSLCSTYLPIYCFQDPGAGTVDTDPNEVSLAPGVAFSAGAAALSNTVTVTGILQPVTVTVTPSAGTVNIILNGVPQGAGPVTAPPNSTLQFSLTVPAVLGTKNTATIAIGDDSYSWWVGYADSAKEARIFATSGTYSGSLGGLSGADATCNSLANASSLGLSGSWKALLSDSTTDAASRISWNWKTLKTVTGTTVVSNGFPDLWDGTLAAPINKDQNGTAVTGYAHTGSLSSGLRDTALASQTYPWCNNWSISSSGGGQRLGDVTVTTATWIYSGSVGTCATLYRFYCVEDVDDTSDTTPNALDIPYNVQVATSSRQSSSAVVISGMSSGATTTLSVTATGGNPKFTVNGGAEVASASVTNGDSIVFKMDAPAGANASNKMTITAGSMTSYWRVWTGWDGGGSGIKRVFVTVATYSVAGDFNGVVGGDAKCQTLATAAALGGTWKAILSGAAPETNAAVNRVGYNWNELQTVTGTTVVYAPNLWKAETIPLLSPIVVGQNGATVADALGVFSNTKANGNAYSTVSDSSNCFDWTTNSALYSPIAGAQSASNGAWINNGAYVSCGSGVAASKHLYCIEQ